MTRAGDTVTADVHLSAFGALAGTVYRADGTTTVAGATVTTTNYQTTTTDEAGRYHFDILPLGAIGVRVDDGTAHGKGVASTTLTTAGIAARRSTWCCSRRARSWSPCSTRAASPSRTRTSI